MRDMAEKTLEASPRNKYYLGNCGAADQPVALSPPAILTSVVDWAYEGSIYYDGVRREAASLRQSESLLP